MFYYYVWTRLFYTQHKIFLVSDLLTVCSADRVDFAVMLFDRSTIAKSIINLLPLLNNLKNVILLTIKIKKLYLMLLIRK